MSINMETVVMTGAALAAGANVQAQDKTISWEQATAQQKKSPVDEFMSTEEYKNLNNAEKVVAYGEFRKKVAPELTESINKEVCGTLEKGISLGAFDGKEVQMAAGYVREHYKDLYDKEGINKIVQRNILAEKALGAKPFPGTMEDRVEMEWSVRRGMVDKKVTSDCIDAIGKDQTLSPEEKRAMQVQELSNYCQRCDSANDRFVTPKMVENDKKHMLNKYPDLKNDVLEKLGQSQGKANSNQQSQANGNINPQLMAHLINSNVR